jgi:hypothetical protein
MPKVKLEDGRMAMLIYRGQSEDERLENALQYHDLQEVVGRLRNRGDLTPGLYNTLAICMQDRVEIIPEEAPGDRTPPRAEPVLSEPEGVPPGDVPAGRVRRPR